MGLKPIHRTTTSFSGWVIWPVKTRPRYDHNVFSGPLNPTQSKQDNAPRRAPLHAARRQFRCERNLSNIHKQQTAQQRHLQRWNVNCSRQN